MSDLFSVAEEIAKEYSSSYTTDHQSYFSILQPGDRGETYTITLAYASEEIVTLNCVIRFNISSERHHEFLSFLNLVNNHMAIGNFVLIENTYLAYRNSFFIVDNEVPHEVLEKNLEYAGDIMDKYYYPFMNAAWTHDCPLTCLAMVEDNICGHA